MTAFWYNYDMSFRLIPLCLLFAVSTPVSAKLVSPEQRDDALARARVRENVDPSTRDTLNGPGGPGSFKAGEEVRCKYEEKDPMKPIGGHTKKFPCWKGDDRLKVKYDGAANREVFGEVAAARLFWALGFFSERMYTVKIVCENCPPDPFVTSDAPRAVRTFDPASVQRKLKGEDLEVTKDEGWTFEDLEAVDDSRGGATRAEVDALKLLAVFVNHGDNTPNQHRLTCLEGDAKCEHPALIASDLGSTFGGHDFLPSYKNWSKKADLWKDRSRCIADFQGTTKGFRDPKISEAGRKLLSDLLGKLSEKQVRELFQGARFDAFGAIEKPLPFPGGKPRHPTVDDWTREFLRKRDQIAAVKCPS